MPDPSVRETVFLALGSLLSFVLICMMFQQAINLSRSMKRVQEAAKPAIQTKVPQPHTSSPGRRDERSEPREKVVQMDLASGTIEFRIDSSPDSMSGLRSLERFGVPRVYEPSELAFPPWQGNGLPSALPGTFETTGDGPGVVRKRFQTGSK